jgi:tRNA pseudouridine32 synthase / 23S rRNA pseudouridine746 synthase
VLDTAPLTLLYCDDAMVAVDKPFGVAVIPAPRLPAGACLRDRLAAQIGTRTWVVHRLDRDTSGVIVFARTAEAHRALSMAFEHRQVRKAYLAFVAGLPSPTRGDIAQPLHEARKGRMRPAAPGEPGALDARTEYAVRQAWRQGGRAVALVEARPHTGRHHQIRVHLRAIGTPILHDPVYGRAVPAVTAGDAAPVARLALHAASLTLPHPESGKVFAIDAPLAADLAALRDVLDSTWTPEPVA